MKCSVLKAKSGCHSASIVFWSPRGPSTPDKPQMTLVKRSIQRFDTCPSYAGLFGRLEGRGFLCGHKEAVAIVPRVPFYTPSVEQLVLEGEQGTHKTVILSLVVCRELLRECMVRLSTCLLWP